MANLTALVYEHKAAQAAKEKKRRKKKKKVGRRAELCIQRMYPTLMDALFVFYKFVELS